MKNTIQKIAYIAILASFLACVFFALSHTGGCGPINGNPPATQPAISRAKALLDAREAYSASERAITQMHRDGKISTAKFAVIIEKGFKPAHAALDAAELLLLDGTSEEFWKRLNDAAKAIAEASK